MTDTITIIFLIQFIIIFGVFVISYAAMIQESLRSYGTPRLFSNFGLALGLAVGTFELFIIAIALFKEYANQLIF